MLQSEIRESTVADLLDKARKRSYGKYLTKVTLSRIRAFTNQPVTFDFPVTALVGPNGGGKTTILGAAACAYRGVRPRQFFAKSGRFDDSMQDWQIQYELIDRTVNKSDSTQRTATFRQSKWNRGALNREVLTFGVARTVPANEKKELQRCATNTFTVPPESIEPLSSEVADAVEKILGKDVAKYSHIQVDSKGRVFLLSGTSNRGVEFSEFHFGAGESSVIRMVMSIESTQENALVLIEEIENGLHPVATRRMVEYLIDFADRRRGQVIFTTHSNDALVPLPDEAIWAALGDYVVQGKLDIGALRAITGQIEAEAAVFTEDEFARAWVQIALRSADEVDIERVEVHGLQGDGTAVRINNNHNEDPSSRTPSLCFIDGDSQQTEDQKKRVYRLPGQCPERYIFSRVLAVLDQCAGELSVAMHRKYDDQEKVKAVLEEVKMTNRDPHLLFGQIGRRLGLVPETTVRDAFISTWCTRFPGEAEALIQPVKDLLPGS